MTTPPSSPIRDYNALSQFQTPEHKIVRSNYGVSRHYETEEKNPIFKGEVLATHRHSAIGDEPERDGFHVSYYTAPSGKEHAIIQQRPTGTPCGYGCVMMLFFDRILQAKNPKAEYIRQSKAEDSYIDHFYRSDTLTSAFKLRQDATQFHTGVTLKVIAFAKKSFPADENIDERVSVDTNQGIIKDLKAKLEKGGSIIQAITHPELKGHWVIIDECDKEGNFYIRDPFSGKAYKVHENELAPMLLKNIQCEYALRVEEKKEQKVHAAPEGQKTPSSSEEFTIHSRKRRLEPPEDQPPPTPMRPLPRRPTHH